MNIKHNGAKSKLFSLAKFQLNINKILRIDVKYGWMI